VTLRNSKGLLFIGAIASALLLSSSARAENIIVTQPTDFWFEYAEPTQFIAQTYMVDGHPSDPQLWLYTEDGVEIINNDDYNGLQSYISIQVQPGRYRLRAGTCCYQPNVWRDGQQWNISYELAFNGNPASTTVAELPTTTLPQATTTDPPQTTSLPTTTTTTTSTVPPTTTTEQTSTTTEVSTTTTTTTLAPVVSSTSVAPSTTELQTTTSTAAPSTTSTTSSTSVPPTTQPPIPEPTLPVPIPTSTSTLPPQITEEEATKIALDPEVLATITEEEATQVFEALVVEDLTDAQVEELIASVSAAPTEVREAFEKTVDIFSGELDTYVPLGSNVPVSTRRTLVTLAAVTMTAAATTRMKW
jgi:hypothetical protein